MIAFRDADLAADAEAMTRLVRLTTSEPVTAEQIHADWQPDDSTVCWTRLAVTAAGEVFGMANVRSDVWLPPNRLRLFLVVEPEQRNRGAGAGLLEAAKAFARTHGGGVTAKVRDDAPEALRFAEKRGFHVERHSFRSTLDLAAFDERPFLGALEHARAAGIRFCSLADFAPATEEHQRKLYDLNCETVLDNPGHRGAFPTFEGFYQSVFEASWFRADGQLLAVDGEDWVGLAAVALSPETGYASNAFTGVRRGYRGRGLATALKLLAIRWAREQGARTIRTGNDSQNASILAINRRLGYRPEPDGR